MLDRRYIISIILVPGTSDNCSAAHIFQPWYNGSVHLSCNKFQSGLLIYFYDCKPFINSIKTDTFQFLRLQEKIKIKQR